MIIVRIVRNANHYRMLFVVPDYFYEIRDITHHVI